MGSGGDVYIADSTNDCVEEVTPTGTLSIFAGICGARGNSSSGVKALAKPVVGLAAAPTGKGYWEVAADGGVFAFGSAPFYGSEGGTRSSAPVVGIVTSGTSGYQLVASDGTEQSFGTT